MWIHEHQDWPNFTWDAKAFASKLADIRYGRGRLLGRMEGLGFEFKREASLSTLANDVVKSSAIEGEQLNPAEVRSSIARRLGIDIAGLVSASRHVEGIVEMMLDATRMFSKPLTKNRLFDWHAALFPTGRSGMRRMTVGGWRTSDVGPIQVVSGPIGPISNALQAIDNVMFKAQLWDKMNQHSVNERQRLIINLMLKDDFKGYINTSKYAKLAKCSNDTALRDIQHLKRRGILIQNTGKGRSTSYRLLKNL